MANRHRWILGVCGTLGIGALGLGCGDAGGQPAIDAAAGRDAATTEVPDGATTSDAGGTTPRDAALPDTGPRVATCTGLPDGSWENITPPGVTTSGAIALDPTDPAVLFATGHGVWRSSDCGASWTLVSTGANGDQIAADGTAASEGLPSAMVIDPVDHDTMYLSFYRGPLNLWKSTNGGVDWERLIDPASEIGQDVQYLFFQSIALDPMDHLHLVAATHANCNPPENTIGCQIESVDGGATWSMVSNPENAAWAENGGALAFGPSHWVYGQPGGRLWITQDHGASWQDHTPAGQMGTTGGFLGAPVVADDHLYYLPTFTGVLRSSDGLTWEDLPGLRGRFVGFAAGSGRIFASDQLTPTYRMASLDDLSHWTELPSPPEGDANGGPHLRYEPTHHVLYTSGWAGGMWRLHVP